MALVDPGTLNWEQVTGPGGSDRGQGQAAQPQERALPFQALFGSLGDPEVGVDEIFCSLWLLSHTTVKVRGGGIESNSSK